MKSAFLEVFSLQGLVFSPFLFFLLVFVQREGLWFSVLVLCLKTGDHICLSVCSRRIILAGFLTNPEVSAVPVILDRAVCPSAICALSSAPFTTVLPGHLSAARSSARCSGGNNPVAWGCVHSVSTFRATNCFACPTAAKGAAFQ